MRGARWGKGRRGLQTGEIRFAALVTGLLDAERERWFLWVPVAMAGGICAYFSLPKEPLLTALAGALGGAGLYMWRNRHRFLPFLAAALITAFCTGLVVAKVKADLVAAPILTRDLPAATVWGFIEELEARPGGTSRVKVRVVRMSRLSAEQTPRRIMSALRKPCDLPQCQPGQPVELLVFLRPPPAPAVPGGYDFARTAYFEEIGGVGFSPRLPEPWLDAPAAPLPVQISSYINQLRGAIAARIESVLSGQTGAIAAALLTGLRGDISEEALQALRASGLAHILAISGLHMSLMAGSLFWVVRALLAASPSLAQGWPIKKMAALIALAGATAYLLISGGSVATQRAFVMVAIMFLAIMLNRPALTMRNVALAACLVMLFSPQSVLTPSFQMSFAAAVALIAAYEYRLGRRRNDAASLSGAAVPVLARPILWLLLYFGAIAVTTLVASAATAPFAAYHFHRVAPFSILGNLLAMPAVAAVVMPAGLAALLLMPFGLEPIALTAMGWGIDWVLWSANLVASWPGADSRVTQMPASSLGLMVLGLLWLLIWHRRWRFFGLLAVAAAIAAAFLPRGPDLLIDGDGKSLAVRRADTGLFDVLDAKRAQFAVSNWLERDGDARDPETLQPERFTCDALGCIAPLAGGGMVALVRHPAALAEDCASARIVIVTFRRTAPCIGPERVIDRQDLKRHGAYALWLDGTRLREQRARPNPGARPWQPAPPFTPVSPSVSPPPSDEPAL